jgi:hypothetical protein
MAETAEQMMSYDRFLAGCRPDSRKAFELTALARIAGNAACKLTDKEKQLMAEFVNKQ